VTSRLRVENYQVGDVLRLNLREFYSDPESIERRIGQLLSGQLDGQAVTIFNGDQRICVLGFSRLWSGVAEVFSVTSDDIIPVRFKFHKMVVGLIESTAICQSIHRMQFSVREGYPRAVRWAGALGFNLEGRMSKYGPDRADHFLYARSF
jgi:hypothetical protein